MISSYFLYSKINLTEKYDEQKLILKKYIFRNLKLYAFWFIALLPITLYYRKWFDAEIFVGFFKFVKAVLFQSTFRASWYIMATIIGTIIVFYLSKKLNAKLLMIVFFLIYLFCCATSIYEKIFYSVDIINNAMVLYKKLFGVPFNSFVVSLFWIFLGKVLSEKNLCFTRLQLIIGFILSAILLEAEHLMIKFLDCAGTDDCYIFLAPITVTIFLVVKQSQMNLNQKVSVFLRKSSTIIYASHASILVVVNAILNSFNISINEILMFSILFVACMTLSALILWLEKYKYFRWLRYSH